MFKIAWIASLSVASIFESMTNSLASSFTCDLSLSLCHRIDLQLCVYFDEGQGMRPIYATGMA